MPKSWKEALLASGLPLENDVQEYFRGKGCISHFEYSYLRPDELEIERQFSYDIDAAYILDNQFVTLMAECKYRHPNTKWIFLPDSYDGPGELHPNDFMHPLDHFVGLRFPFRLNFPRHLAPACSKGVELAGDERNQKSITQALSQLAYAMAPKIADAIEHQVERLLVYDHIFFHVPMVVTTAGLFRINAGVTIKEIKEAHSLDKVALQEEMLVLHYTPGIELKKYNLNVLNALRQRLGEPKLTKSMQTFTDSIDHLFSVLSDHYSPKAFVIISVSKGWQSFDQFFRYVYELLNPSEELLREIREQEGEIKERLKELGLKLKGRRRRPKSLLKKPRGTA
jgi:DNA-binding transcriptional MerR regulator